MPMKRLHSSAMPHRSVGAARLSMMIAVAALLVAGGAYFYSRGFGGEEKQAPKKTAEPPEVYRIGEFLLNVKTNGELRYLRVEVAASIEGYESGAEETSGHGSHGSDSDEELLTLQQQEEALARDAIVQILSDMDFATLRTSEGRKEAKETIRETLDELFDGADVKNVLFLAFVMQ